MLVLNANEYLIKQIDSKCKIHNSNISGKGILYITNNRIVFEDNKKGIILQLTYNEIIAYRLDKGLKKKISIDFMRGNRYLLEIKCNDIDNIFNDIKRMIDNYNTMIKVPIYKWEDNGMYGEYRHVEDKVFNSWEEYEKFVLPILNNFNVSNKYVYLDQYKLAIEPYIKRWISDIDFSRWNYPSSAEYYYLRNRIRAEDVGYKTLVNSIANNHTPYFLDKVAKEAMKLQASIKYIDSQAFRNNYRDTNKYWIGEIEDWLVGINVNHWDSNFILHYSRSASLAQASISDYYFVDKDRIREDKECKFGEAAKRWWSSLIDKDIDNARKEARIILSSYREHLDILDYTGRFELIHLYLEEMVNRNISIPEYKPNYIK
jgi:hypothetical protein